MMWSTRSAPAAKRKEKKKKRLITPFSKLQDSLVAIATTKAHEKKKKQPPSECTTPGPRDSPAATRRLHSSFPSPQIPPCLFF
jgi:hypothetical protein